MAANCSVCSAHNSCQCDCKDNDTESIDCIVATLVNTMTNVVILLLLLL